jgi:hypothetical protein
MVVPPFYFPSEIFHFPLWHNEKGEMHISTSPKQQPQKPTTTEGFRIFILPQCTDVSQVLVVKITLHASLFAPLRACDRQYLIKGKAALRLEQFNDLLRS